MAGNISIKLTASEDTGAVLQFLWVTIIENDAVLVPHLNETSEKTEVENIDLISRFDDYAILLAMLGEEIVGVITVMILDHQPTTGELGIVIWKGYQRNGVGRLLVNGAEYRFNTYSSLENLILTVFEDNIPAANLYQQLYFVTIGKTIEQGHNALQMQYDSKKEETMEK